MIRKKYKKMPNLEENKSYQGYVIHWNDEKGYGFIQLNPKYQNLFFHISTFAYHHCRPKIDDAVIFTVEPGKNNGWQAKRVVLLQDQDAIYENSICDIAENSHPKKFEGFLYAALDALYFLILSYISLPLAITAAVLSVLTVALYSYDKKAAAAGERRVPDASFHIASLLGGWPGALFARPMLRHKIRQQRFKVFFWASIVINFCALYALILWLPDYSPLLSFWEY